MSSRVRVSRKTESEDESPELAPSPTSVSTTPSTPSAPAVEEPTPSKGEGLRLLLNNPENGPVIKKLIITTVLMFTLPFAAFFGFRDLDYVGMPLLHMYFRDRDLVGAIGALVSIQVLIIFYVYIGLTEKDEREDPSAKVKTE